MNPSGHSLDRRKPAARWSVEECCSHFRLACQSGALPKVEDYVLRVAPELHADLVQRLLLLELGHRCNHGEAPAPSEYVSRLPTFRAAIESAFAEFRAQASAAVTEDDNSTLPYATDRRGATCAPVDKQLSRYEG